MLLPTNIDTLLIVKEPENEPEGLQLQQPRESPWVRLSIYTAACRAAIERLV